MIGKGGLAALALCGIVLWSLAGAARARVADPGGAPATGQPGGKITARGWAAGGSPVRPFGGRVRLPQGGSFGLDIQLVDWNSFEVAVAADPTRPLAMLANMIDLRGNTHALTTDGGATWVAGGTNDGRGDPGVAFNTHGIAFISQLGAPRHSGPDCPDPVQVQYSANGGVIFGSAFTALTDPDPTNHFLDKDWIMIDTNPASPYRDRVYAAATDFWVPGCDLSNPVNDRMVLAYSTDSGQTWSPSTTVSDPAHDQDQFAMMVAAPNGTVYYTYQYQDCTSECNGVPMSNLLTHSTDGGVSWSPAITITGQPISYTGAFVGGTLELEPGIRSNNMPVLGASPHDSQTVYAVWADGRWETTYSWGGHPAWHADIAFSRSTDGGTTWSAPQRINDDPAGSGNDQFFPWLAVGSDGTLHVTWDDRRAGGTAFLEYYSRSTDGGQTWSPNLPISDAPSELSPGAFVGDYNGLAVSQDNSRVIAAWGDTRNGVEIVSDGNTEPPVVALPSVTPSPGPTPGCLPGWTTQPSPNAGALDNTLRGIAVVSAANAWAVGSAGAGFHTLVEHWDGAAWQIVPSPDGGELRNELRSVAAVSATDVWAVGTYEINRVMNPLVEHWDGSQWTVVPTPIVSLYGTFLNGVAARAGNDVWAVGYYGRGDGAGDSLILHWNGSQWSEGNPPQAGVGGSNFLNAVVAPAADNVWAIGDYAAFGLYYPLALHWDGGQWSLVTLPAPGPGLNYLNGAVALAPDDIWAVGGEGYVSVPLHALVEHWDGVQWHAVPSAELGPVDALLAGVTGAAGDLWAVGWSHHIDDAQPLVEHWDGTAWTVASGPAAAPGSRLLATAQGDGALWAVGDAAPLGGSRTLIARYEAACTTATPPPPPPATATATVSPPVSATATPQTPATPSPTATFSTATPSPTAAFSTATPAACVIPFSDVPANSPFFSSIRCLVCRGIVSGYGDGTFRPGASVTRGQLAKFIANATGYADAIPPAQQTFADVPPDQPFWLYVERAVLHGIISGYSCGGPGEPCPGRYFRPANPVTRGQTAKLVAGAAGYQDPIPPGQQTFADVPPDQPFWLYVERAVLHGIISGYSCGGPGEPCPGRYFRPGTGVTRGQSAKFVANAWFPACASPAR